jgi:catechol 2,3-dioxygenase-like lactoylglutathione lyase family enzyme
MDHGIRVSTVNISAPDASALAAFYAELLGWEVVVDEGDWTMIGGPESVRISFEYDAAYQPPVWPTEPGKPPMQLHLEVRVTDLPGALAHALACGATLADRQPQDDVRVCLDPAGHPFCLWLDEAGDDDGSS